MLIPGGEYKESSKNEDCESIMKADIFSRRLHNLVDKNLIQVSLYMDADARFPQLMISADHLLQFNNQNLEVDQYNKLLQGYQNASVNIGFSDGLFYFCVSGTSRCRCTCNIIYNHKY